jgi:DNA-directed RNA polymerase specialized sigma24 family protein
MAVSIDFPKPAASNPLTRKELDALYRAHAGELRKQALAILRDQPWDADDVVQDAFVELMTRAERPKDALAYLGGVVRRMCMARGC